MNTITRQQAKAWRKKYSRQKSSFEKRCDSLKRLYENIRYPKIKQYRESGKRNYNGRNYWHAVGEPVIQELLKSGGFWEEIYAPDQVHQSWDIAPDDLVLMHTAQKVCNQS